MSARSMLRCSQDSALPIPCSPCALLLGPCNSMAPLVLTCGVVLKALYSFPGPSLCTGTCGKGSTSAIMKMLRGAVCHVCRLEESKGEIHRLQQVRQPRPKQRLSEVSQVAERHRLQILLRPGFRSPMKLQVCGNIGNQRETGGDVWILLRPGGRTS